MYFALCLSAALSGCSNGSSDGSSDNQNPSQQIGVTGTGADSAPPILESIYSNRRTPDGFYTEAQAEPNTFETIRHIKNIDMMDPADYDESTPRYELCADDFDQALGWSTSTSTELGDLVDNSDHRLYYQFVYVPLNSPETRNLQRVFKCNIVDRSTLDTRALSGNIGRYTETTQNEDHIRLLIEYLWTFSEYNNYGNAILSSNIENMGSYYLLTMEHARLTPAAGLDAECDRVDLYQVDYRTEQSTGEVTVSETLLSTQFSVYRDGEIIVCGEQT
jgi:hypothetical protein